MIGEDVTVGHGVILHSCDIRGKAIIGMGSTLLDNCVIEENCIIGANSLVSPRTVIPSGSLAFGNPARVVRPLKPEEIEFIQKSAAHYREVAAEYRKIFSKMA